VTALLKIPELLYRGVNRVRRAAYRAGILKSRKLPAPVISVGNIGIGGGGKTPAVIAIARELSDHGLRVGVLTRGYGRAGEGGVVDSADTARFGDEPVLIKKKAPNAAVIVGVKRHANAVQNPCDVYVLDDGFQHLTVARDLDIVVENPASRFLREGRGALDAADIVLQRNVRPLIPDHLRGKRVFAFAGLADNEQFFQSLREGGLDVVATRTFADHHPYSADDLASIRAAAKGADAIVTTEKDAVKIAAEDITAIPAEFHIPDEVMERIVGVATGQMPRDRRSQQRKKSRTLERLEYTLYRTIAKRVEGVSDASIQRWGAVLGWVGRRVLRGRQRLALRNLAMIFPGQTDSERRAILDRTWRHFGRQALDYVRLQGLPSDELLKRVPFTNTHRLDAAVARGRGVMVISAHFGSWELGGLALMSGLKNVRAVARRLDNELLERDLTQIRSRTGAEVLDRRRAARPLLKALSENGVVILLPDQAVQPREGVLVPFLGRNAWTTDAPAKLALRLGSTIVFAFCIPDGSVHRLDFDESINVDELSDDERTAEALTTRINDVISRRIATRPELWLWMHDRWKGTA
jgi:lauroyl/myristoyl acyltransferase/tetraacyldisaccharide-1-P 4'-kinase